MREEVKQDINFLDKPLWMQTTVKDTKEIITWEDQEGYKFECAGYAPGKVDMLILYFLMLESQNRNWGDKLVLTQYAVLNGCGMVMGKRQRERLKQALEAWRRTTISFSGTWYSGKKYHDMEFGIVEYWAIREKDKKLEIRLNQNWIEKIRQSEFFKYVSFTQMKSIRSPLALRLYEILVKSFFRRTTWEIDALKLAAKIPMSEKYFADITPKIKTATKRVSEKTDLNVKVAVVKQGRGKGKFIFTRLETKKPVQGELFTAAPPPELPENVMQKLPARDRVACQKICQEIIARDGADGLRFYIGKAVGRKQSDRSNTSGYLKTIFEMDLYADVKAAKRAAVDQARADLREQQEVEARDCQEQERAKAGREALAKLKERNPERYRQLRQQVAGNLGIDLGRMKRGDSLNIDLGIAEIISNSCL
jgi:hypothetical protein